MWRWLEKRGVTDTESVRSIDSIDCHRCVKTCKTLESKEIFFHKIFGSRLFSLSLGERSRTHYPENAKLSIYFIFYKASRKSLQKQIYKKKVYTDVKFRNLGWEGSYFSLSFFYPTIRKHVECFLNLAIIFRRSTIVLQLL